MGTRESFFPDPLHRLGVSPHGKTLAYVRPRVGPLTLRE